MKSNYNFSFFQPFDYGRKHVLRSSLLHNSRWLFGIYHNGNLSDLETNSTDLDNVAVIKYPLSFLNVQPQNDMVRIDDRM